VRRLPDVHLEEAKYNAQIQSEQEVVHGAALIEMRAS
jgi:hypothetical protein